MYTTMGHEANLQLTHTDAGLLREMRGNSALHVVLQHDMDPRGKQGAFQYVTLFNNTVSLVGSANKDRRVLHQGRPTVQYDHFLKRTSGEVHQCHPCGPGLKCDELIERSRRRMDKDKDPMARLHRVLRHQLS